jgi:oligoendopeptidase F
MVVCLATAVLAAPETLVRDSIPEQYRWDFADIYPDWDAWAADKALLESKMTDYANLQGTLSNGPENVLRAYALSDTLGMLMYKVYRYPGLQRSVDQKNNDMAAKLQEVQYLFAEFQTQTAWFNPELLAIPWETMEKWLDDNPGLEPYNYAIENTYRQQKHVLTEDKEQLLSFFSQFAGTPTSAYASLSTSDIEYDDVDLSNGDTVKLTPGRYYNILSNNRNQEDRRRAFETFYSVYHSNVNTYAALYNSILQRDWAQARARQYENTLETALDGNNVSTEVFETLLTQVKAGTEPLQRYARLRKKTLGLETYHLYDGSVPLVDFDKTYDYEEVQEWVVDAVAPLGGDYQKKMKRAFGERWIDVYENEGKSTGAYSAGVYGVHPYLLMNYNETLNNVFTLAHELGHMMHTTLSDETQPFATADYTIFVAEVASTLNEALLLEYMFARSQDPKERIALLSQAIDNITGTFYTQVMFADFEWQAHKKVERGEPITADVLRSLYFGLLEEYYGNEVELDDLYGSTWTRISHFYNSPYYVYQYATCFASSAQIVAGILSEDELERSQSLEKYMTLLKSGGNDYPMEQLKKAGVDLTSPEPFKAVITHLDKLVTRLEQELANLEG